MTLTASAPTSTDPTARSLWQAARTPLAVLVVVVLAGCALALATAGRGGEPLDPESAAPAGSRALAQLLRGQGVQVVRAGTTAEAVGAAGPGTTLLVVGSDRLSEHQLRQLRGARNQGADLVVPAAGAPTLQALAPAVRLGAGGPAEVREPRCALPAAERAGTAHTGGVTYLAPADAERCYPGKGGPSLVVVGGGAGAVTLLGDAAALTNGHLAEEGDAALALGLLGASDTLVWYLPTLADVADPGAPSLGELTPGWVTPALLLLVLVGVACALWRGRRFGPLVAENLPVTVKAGETMEGRARLYARSGARLRAIDTLRVGTTSRLAARLGLPRTATVDDIAGHVAALCRRPLPEIRAVLVDAVPAGDRDLVALSDRLAALEREVHRLLEPGRGEASAAPADAPTRPDAEE